MYETPVLGPPWIIPMEFPLYQWIVGAVVQLTNLELDQAGRATSIALFYLSFPPLLSLLKDLKVKPEFRRACCALFLGSPLFLVFSRTFMIESTAFFLSITYLAFVSRYFCKGSWLAAALALTFGILAAVTKVTTFAGFLLAAGFLTLGYLREHRGNLAKRSMVPTIFFAALPCVVVKIWLHLADLKKALNPFANDLLLGAGVNQFEWNYGTLNQRFSIEMLLALQRDFDNIFGFWPIPIILLLLLSKNFLRTPSSVFLLLIYVLGYFVLTNVYIVHNYYAYANAGFFIVMLSLLFNKTAENETRQSITAAGFVLLFTSQIFGYHSYWRSVVQTNQTQHRKTAESVQTLTSEDQAFAIFGYDWSSVLPYYSQRRALAVPFKYENDYETILESFSAMPQGKPALILFCSRYRGSGVAPETQQRLNLAKRAFFADQTCLYYKTRGK